MFKAVGSPAAPAPPWKARHADDDYGAGAEPNWREVDWQGHLNQTEIDGVEINYVDIGSGADNPVIFVHGLAGQWQNWLENIPRISQERRVIAPDLPGHGASGPPRDEFSISGCGRVVHGLAQRLGIERAMVVGNSMGGFVSSEVAIQFPDFVERLMLVSAAGISSASVSQAPVMTLGRVGQALTSVTAARHRKLAARPVTRHFAMALVARHPSRLKGDFVWEGFMTGAGRPSFLDALRANLDYDFRERISEIRCPTLIVWGGEDAIIPVRDADEYERLIDDARKVVMEDTGHIPMAERPAAFNDLLLEFIAETGPAEDKEPVDHESERV
ncbi:MAG TPA: alpha/beta fold hydrolase [Thermoleophilaceae bacterium]|nr:alpha/beta fold hydrolase [Thermoleophilaceae bacterium]